MVPSLTISRRLAATPHFPGRTLSRRIRVRAPHRYENRGFKQQTHRYLGREPSITTPPRCSASSSTPCRLRDASHPKLFETACLRRRGTPPQARKSTPIPHDRESRLRLEWQIGRQVARFFMPSGVVSQLLGRSQGPPAALGRSGEGSKFGPSSGISMRRCRALEVTGLGRGARRQFCSHEQTSSRTALI